MIVFLNAKRTVVNLDNDRLGLHEKGSMCLYSVVTREDLVTLRDNLTKYLEDTPKPLCEDVNCPCPDCNDWTGQHQVLSREGL